MSIATSTCLPTIYQAVEIHDPATDRLEAYWDGGYIGNPALFPLFYETDCRDVLIVHINPVHREDLPRAAREIENRINEISFTSSLLRELRNVEFVQRLIAGHHEGGELVQCEGVNGCKGQSECATDHSACHGHNDCAGKGWIKMTAEECEKAKAAQEE